MWEVSSKRLMSSLYMLSWNKTDMIVVSVIDKYRKQSPSGRNSNPRVQQQEQGEITQERRRFLQSNEIHLNVVRTDSEGNGDWPPQLYLINKTVCNI